MSVALLGAEKCERDLRGIIMRLDDLRPIIRPQFQTLEASEAAVFAELGGRYVNTGAVKNSLTLPRGKGRIRRASRKSAKFGTSIYYARFLTEHIGPKSDKGGMKRPEPVAVLRLPDATRRVIAHDVVRRLLDTESASIENML